MWPPFGALLALELYETGEGGLHRAHAIRLVYNGEAHPHPHPKPKPKPNPKPDPDQVLRPGSVGVSRELPAKVRTWLGLGLS